MRYRLGARNIIRVKGCARDACNTGHTQPGMANLLASGPADAVLAEIENAGGGIVVHLRTMQHAAARDLRRMRARLREMVCKVYGEGKATAVPRVEDVPS